MIRKEGIWDGEGEREHLTKPRHNSQEKRCSSLSGVGCVPQYEIFVHLQVSANCPIPRLREFAPAAGGGIRQPFAQTCTQNVEGY